MTGSLRAFIIGSVIAAAILSGTLLCSEVGAQQRPPPDVITNISSWSHPAKAVFAKNGIKLTKVEISNKDKEPYRKYYVFFISLPYDPQTSETTSYFNKLYMALLQATKYEDYALVDEADKLKIEISWNKAKRKLSVDIVPLG